MRKEYIGKTSRCTNERLKEHKLSVQQDNMNLGIHARYCSTKACAAEFGRLDALKEHNDQLVQEIIEAAEIARPRDQCVSTPSVLLKK